MAIFAPFFRDKIDELLLRFFNLTLILLDSILLLEVEFGKMNEKTEKCSQARYARTILKVTIFLVKSDTVFSLSQRKLAMADIGDAI